MKHKTYKSFLTILIFLSVLTGIKLDGHGFTQGTLIRTSEDGWWSIEQVCRLSSSNRNQKIASYNPRVNHWVKQRVKSAGESETNCYFRIGFDNNSYNDIVCTPTQEFYLPSTRQWTPAYKLKPGDTLLRQHDKLIQIAHVEFIKKTITVHTLEIKKTHTFLVGPYSILTHNMVLPIAFSAGLSIPFGSAVMGAIGGFLGPITATAGIGLGAIIGLAVKAVYEDQIPTYKIPMYDITLIEKHHCQHSTPTIESTGYFNSAHATNNSFDNVKHSNSIETNQAHFPSPKYPKNDDDKDTIKDHPNGTYKGAKYHHKNSNDLKSPAPKDGQKALDNSAPYNKNSPHRVGTSEGEIVVLSQTSPGEFHGHVRTWAELLSEGSSSEKIRNTLTKKGFVNFKGKILK